MANYDADLLEALIQTESSGNPNAFNKGSGARGLTQITPIAWQDLVQRNPKTYSSMNYAKDIFNPDVSRQAGQDYLNIVKGYLKAYKIAPTIDNILGAYNWGIGNVKNQGIGKAPLETRNYIKKIRQIMSSKGY